MRRPSRSRGEPADGSPLQWFGSSSWASGPDGDGGFTRNHGLAGGEKEGGQRMSASEVSKDPAASDEGEQERRLRNDPPQAETAAGRPPDVLMDLELPFSL